MSISCSCADAPDKSVTSYSEMPPLEVWFLVWGLVREEIPGHVYHLPKIAQAAYKRCTHCCTVPSV